MLYTIEAICNAIAATCGDSRPRATIPLSFMLAAGWLFEVAGKVGLRTSINRARVMKIVQSTNIRPAKLLDSRYPFRFDLAGALRHWKQNFAERRAEIAPPAPRQRPDEAMVHV